MSRAFLTSLDLSQNELQNGVMQNLGTAPSSPKKGQIYLNTGDSTLYWWDGSQWVSARGGAASVPPATTTALGTIQLAGDLTGTATVPTIANLAVTAAKVANATLTDVQVAAANKDGTAGTASMRTLGAGAAQAAAGNDSRFSDSRTPTGPAGGSLTGTYPNPTVALLAINDTMVAVANKDGAAGTPSLRTLGTGAAQAVSGTDSRLSDSRAPNGGAGGDLTGSYPNPTIGVGKVTSTAILDGTIAVGDLAFTPVKSGDAAGGDLTGTYPNPTIGVGKVTSTAILDGTIAVTDTAAAFTVDALATSHPMAAALAMNSKQITSLSDPTNPQDAATKNYVDATAQGLDAKASVRLGSTPAGGNLTLTGAATIDGSAVVTGDRVLVKDQTTPAQNGIYIANTGGAWTRATDLDTWAEVPSAYVWVESGTANADTGWLSTADPGGTLGTTAMPWVQFAASGAAIAGTGLTKTGNTIDVVAGDTSLTVAADSVVVNTAVIASRAYTDAQDALSPLKTLGLTAGNGLTGGGDLSAARTFDVGAGTGITVAADTVAVDTAVIATRAYTDAQDLLSPLKTVQINTTAPLTGGGDLSANRTLAISNFTSGAAGAVPASGGGTTAFLRADATWVVPPAGTVQKVTAACAAATSTVVNTTAINSRDVTVGVYRSTTPWDEVECDVERTSATSVTIRFATAPTAGAYNIVVTG